MKLSSEVALFAARLGHDFGRPELLIRALTHASLASPGRADNERLEFLGDRVLGLVIAEALLAADPDAAEGQLAPRLNALVRREACAAVARALDVGAALKLGRSEQMSGGRRKEALLADAMEALVAAVFIDAGFEAARRVILRHWTDRIAAADGDARDAKTTLQEWAQARGLPPPEYVEIDRRGPPHAPEFEIEVCLTDGRAARAVARSKRIAQQAAAEMLIAQLEPGA